MSRYWLIGLGILLAPNAAGQTGQTRFTYETCLADHQGAVPDTRHDLIDREQRSCVLGVGVGCVSPLHAVAILAGDEEGRAFLRYGSELTDSLDKRTWSIEATVPFDKDTKQGKFGALSGLSGDLVISPTFSHTTWSPLNAKGYATALCSTCRELDIELLRDCDPSTIATIARDKQISESEIERTRLEIQDAAFERIVGRAWTLEISFGRKVREFFEDGGDVTEDDRVGYSFGLSRSWFLKYGHIALEGLSKTDYEEADEATRCTPIEGTVLEECKVKPRSRASTEDALIAAVGGKLLVPVLSLAVAPRVEYDFEDSNWGLQVPIYLLRTEEGALTGGLHVGWESDPGDGKDNWGAAVFVSKPLKF